jgi:hypothetical protein
MRAFKFWTFSFDCNKRLAVTETFQETSMDIPPLLHVMCNACAFIITMPICRCTVKY